MNAKNLKTMLISFILSLLFLIGCTFLVYKLSFAPKGTVTLLTEASPIDNRELLKKFIPNDINFSIKEIAVSSNTSFSSGELTNLAVNTLKDNVDNINYLEGVDLSFEDNLLKVKSHINYRGIPLECNLFFSVKAIDGNGVIKFEKGKLGFISLDPDSFMEYIPQSDFLTLDSQENEIIISLKKDMNIEITEMYINEDNLILNFNGKIKLF